jgi:hypothetical protein
MAQSDQAVYQRKATYTAASGFAADRLILWIWNDVLPAWAPLDTIVPIMPQEVSIALAVLIGGLVFKLTGGKGE